MNATRQRLPATRSSITHTFRIGTYKGFITVGVDAAGSPKEMFLTMDKEHPTVRGIAQAWAITLSIALQAGTPLSAFTAKYTHQRFPPDGFTGSPDIPNAKSIVDYIGQWLENTFLKRDDNHGDEASAKGLSPFRHPGSAGAPAVATGCPHGEGEPNQ